MSLCKEGLRAAFWGAGPASQLDGDGLHVSWVPESFVSVSFTHTQPFTAVLTHPSFMLPLVGPACQCPHPLWSLFLLLPCLALALTLRITHSLSVHNSSSELAHEHTHSGTRFPCILPAVHVQCPCHYTLMHTCTPTHPESDSFHACTPALSCQGWGVTLGMSSQLLTPTYPNFCPPFSRQRQLAPSHPMYVNSNTCPLTRSGVLAMHTSRE